MNWLFLNFFSTGSGSGKKVGQHKSHRSESLDRSRSDVPVDLHVSHHKTPATAVPYHSNVPDLSAVGIVSASSSHIEEARRHNLGVDAKMTVLKSRYEVLIFIILHRALKVLLSKPCIIWNLYRYRLGIVYCRKQHLLHWQFFELSLLFERRLLSQWEWFTRTIYCRKIVLCTNR